MRRLLLLAIAALATAGLTASTAGAAQDLSALVLDAGQVGKGYTMQRPAGGSGTTVPTLDLCGLSYPSEGKRRTRLQVIYGAKTAVPGVSNEVVEYAAGGAAQAMKEAAGAAARCPKKPVTQGATSYTYAVSRLDGAGFPAGSVAISVKVTATQGGKSSSLEAIIVYVRKGDTLSGVYVYGGSASARASLAKKLGAASASRISQSVGGQAA